MPSPGRPRGVPLVLSLQALVVALVVAWFATGHASAPDGGLQQLDVLVVHERVPGLAPVSGRPTIVFTAGRCPGPGRLAVARRNEPGHLGPAYAMAVLGGPPLAGAVVVPDPGGRLTGLLALGQSLSRCQPGYALVDGAGFVRYRTYDPHPEDHAAEESVLLENLR